MSKLYKFYVRLDRLEYEFTHYLPGWPDFKPQPKYSLGKQISLILGTSAILVFKAGDHVYNTLKKISDKLSVTHELEDKR